MTDQRIQLLSLLVLLLVLAGCQRADVAANSTPPPRVTTTLAATFTPGGPGRQVSEAAVPTRMPTPERSPEPTATPDLPPAGRLEAGLAAERLGNWEAAQGWYTTLRDDPRYGNEAMYYAGDLYARMDRYVEAASAWTLGVELEPEGEFSAAMLYRLGRGAAETGQHDAALDFYRRADELSDAADAVLAQRIAESYVAEDEMERAAAEWERVYNHPQVLRVNRALTAKELGDWHAENERWLEAITWYQATLDDSQVESFRAELIFQQGVFAEEAGEIERARAYWQAVLDEYPGEGTALDAVAELEAAGTTIGPLELGAIYLANEEYMRANDAFVEALEAPAHAAEGHRGLAHAGEGNGNLDGAIEEWTKIIETHPESSELFPEAWYQLGRVHLERGEEAEAFSDWQTLLEQFPESPFAGDALYEWGDYYHGSDSIDEAIAKWEQLVAGYPDHASRAEAIWTLGQLHYTRAEFEAAQVAFTDLASIDEQPERAMFWTGKSALAMGDTEGAEAVWKATIERAPEGFYALRANDLLAEKGWSGRGHDDFTIPDGEFEADGEPLPADEPWLAQGLLLSRMGELGWANSSFLRAIDEFGEEPAALWEITQQLNEIGAYNAQSAAAMRLIHALGYTTMDAPPALLAYAYPMPYAEELSAATAEYNEDPLFVAAMIYQESRWQARALSSASARGLLQVIPDTGRWIAVRIGDLNFAPSELYRPLTALEYGTYYLDYCLDQFDDNPYLALAAYNGGPGNVARWRADDPDLFIERINFPETRSYVELVYTHYHAYVRAYR